METHNCLPADGINEAVDDDRHGMRRNLGSANLRRVAIHAAFPVLADRLQGRCPSRSPAVVVKVAFRADCHVGQNGIGHFLCSLLELGTDR